MLIAAHSIYTNSSKLVLCTNHFQKPSEIGHLLVIVSELTFKEVIVLGKVYYQRVNVYEVHLQGCFPVTLSVLEIS